jgi:hypothetical protein
MAVLRWQWTLPNRGLVEAAIDTAVDGEIVTQGGAELSRSARGAKPDGHVVLVKPGPTAEGESIRPSIEAVLTFAASAPICVLRVDGEEIAPTVWPSKDRTSPRDTRKAPIPWLRYGGMALGITMMVVAGLSIRAARKEPPPPSNALELTYRAPSGLFIAHYPADVEPRRPVLPSGVSGVVLEDRGKSTGLVVAALRLDPSASRDPWALQQRLFDDALANVNRNASKYEETGRRDDTCHGRPGAVVTGRLLLRELHLARIWSCTFVADDAGYLIITALAEPASRADEHRLRTIADAVEPTHLAEIGTPESSP